MSERQFDEVLTRLQRHVDRIAEGDEAARAGFALPDGITGEGSSDRDRVKVRVSGGEVTDVQIDIRALRQDTAELGRQVKDAVNAALTDHAAQVAAAMADEQSDFSSLQTDLRDIQAQSLQAMTTYTNSMFAALDQMRTIAKK